MLLVGVNHNETYGEHLGYIHQNYKYALCAGSSASIIFLADSLMHSVRKKCTVVHFSTEKIAAQTKF